MKFTILFIGMMLLKGIKLHRHRNRHGHNGQRTDPQREINELNEIDKAVDKQQIAHATEVQTDIRSNPGNMIENAFKTDSTKMAQYKNGTR